MITVRQAIQHDPRRVDYWTLFGIFDVASLQERFKGCDCADASQLARAVGELAHETFRGPGHMLPVANAALRRSEGDLGRALELSTVFYHVIREVAGRNLAREYRYESMSPYGMVSKFGSYATVLLGMDDMVEMMEHMSPGGDPPVELLAAMFL